MYILVYANDKKPNNQHGRATATTYSDDTTNGRTHKNLKEEMKTEFKTEQDEISQQMSTAFLF